MRANAPRPLRRLALLLGFAAALVCPLAATAGLIAPGLTVRSEGKAPVQGGRVDMAYQQALEEAFRRGLLEALHIIAPDRQSPLDLETWQGTVLSRAGDFVGAWRILSQVDKDGLVTLEAEIEVYRDKLARAARATAATAFPAVRVVVFAVSRPIVDDFAVEEIDAGGAATAALEAELARRGAIIVSTTNRAPWVISSGTLSEENRVSLAAAAALRLDADAALVADVTRQGETLALSVQLIATASGTTLVSAKTEVPKVRNRSLAEAFAPAARQLAATCAPHLAAARHGRRNGSVPGTW